MSKSPFRLSGTLSSPATDWFLRLLSPARRECARIELLISLDIDGLATNLDKSEIAAHAASCSGCQALLAVSAVTSLELRDRPRIAMPQSLAERLAAVMIEERRRERDAELRKQRPPARRAVPAFASALAVAVVAGIVINIHEQRPTAPLAPNDTPVTVPRSHGVNLAAKPAVPTLNGGVVSHVHSSPVASPRTMVAALPQSELTTATHARPLASSTALGRANHPASVAISHAVTDAALPKGHESHNPILHIAPPAASGIRAAPDTSVIASARVPSLQSLPVPAQPEISTGAAPASRPAEHPSAPIVVAEVPAAGEHVDATVAAHQLAPIRTATYTGDAHMRLPDTLRNLALATQSSKSGTVATADLTRFAQHASDYSESLSMVSAPVH